MKKLFSLSFLLLLSSVALCQYKVRFVFDKLPSYHKSSDSVYIAGAFNGWNPSHHKFSTSIKSGLKNGITIELPRGMHEYKFTHGAWDAVESGDGGFPTQNRLLAVETDTTVHVQIDHWADHFPKKSKESSASCNVQILDSAFYIPQLNRHRRVWIYLPGSYANSKKKYPVIYMQDGQNLFDNATAAYGEWGVDKALDTMCRIHGEAIVVGIDHGTEKRMTEYSPFEVKNYGKGEGDAYVDFLAETLIPYINRNYRTKKSAQYTSIAGSSMGGLISLYAIIKRPDKFGAAGVFSPALWIVPELKEYIAKRAPKVKGRIYFYAGGLEGERMVPDMLTVVEQLSTKSKAKLQSRIRAEGRHNEQAWQQEFPLFYDWLMKEEK